VSLRDKKMIAKSIRRLLLFRPNKKNSSVLFFLLVLVPTILQILNYPRLTVFNSSVDDLSVHGSSNPDINKVLVIGGAGYVGSYLSAVLQSKGLHVTIFDKAPNLAEDFNPAIPVVEKHSKDVTQSDLCSFGTVIFLGGCTGRNSCDLLSVAEVEEENVSNVIDIMKKMSSSQHFVAASTSAITEGSCNAKEDVKVKYNLLDSYSMSMLKREVRLKEFLDHDEKEEYPKLSLLRFGTVVGNSPGQRTDLMIPSFFRSAYTIGRLEVGGHNTMRSFLTLRDLSNAIHTLISKTNQMRLTPTDALSRFNIWHLASFDATVFKIASTVASLTGATIDSFPSDKKLSPLISSQGGFSLDSTAFEKFFSFTFEDSLLTTIHDFDRNVPDSIIPKGPHQVYVKEDKSTIPCPVCGSTGQQVVLDLGSQPQQKKSQLTKTMQLPKQDYRRSS
jgi:nucleoside-diphosphate-sugar epimerase